MRFRDKVVVVTGGGQGIGCGIARAFAREGATVVIAEIDTEAGMENCQYILGQHGKACFIETDVAREDSIRRLFDTVAGRWGKIDILVNNAGINYRGDMLADPVEVWDKIINVNLRGAYLCAKYATLNMKDVGGCIINIASTRALMSETDSEAYAASKGGIVALTHALAVSLGPRGIRVNAISPGWIEVSDWKKQSCTVIPHHSEKDKAQHPVGRVGTPDDIAEACLYLTAKEAGFITGVNLVVDGGMTVKMIYED